MDIVWVKLRMQVSDFAEITYFISLTGAVLLKK
jgi:hypothetical protein